MNVRQIGELKDGIITMYNKIGTTINRLLQEKDQILIAIDGKSAAGKSTLADWIFHNYDCNVFHMDDFFLRPFQRTHERFLEPGGNVDYERVKAEVLDPLLLKKEFSFRPFSCATFELGDAIYIEPKTLNIIEGVYSLHPTLISSYDYKIFLDIREETQTARIAARDGEAKLSRYLNEWIPLENRYFSDLEVAKASDIQFLVG